MAKSEGINFSRINFHYFDDDFTELSEIAMDLESEYGKALENVNQSIQNGLKTYLNDVNTQLSKILKKSRENIENEMKFHDWVRNEVLKRLQQIHEIFTQTDDFTMPKAVEQNQKIEELISILQNGVF